MDMAPEATLNVRIHVTAGGISSTSVYKPEKEADEASSMGKSFSSALEPTSGRADLRELVSVAGSTGGHKSVGIAGELGDITLRGQKADLFSDDAACGPASLVFDVRNAVADVQKDILLGRTGCTEMFLHTEEYSW